MKSITIPYRIVRRTQTVALLTDQLTSFGGGSCVSTSIVKVSGEVPICEGTPQERTVAKASHYYISFKDNCPSAPPGGTTIVDGYNVPFNIYINTAPCTNCQGRYLTLPEFRLNLPMGPGNPCDCESDGTVVGVCKECKKGLPIASPDRIKGANSPEAVQMINTVLGAASEYVGELKGSPNISASKIERCCGTQGWRSGNKVSGNISYSGTPVKGSKDATLTISGYDFSKIFKLVSAKYEVGWDVSGTVSIDDDPCKTGCNSQSEITATMKASGGIETLQVPFLNKWFNISGNVTGRGNVNVTTRCGVTTTSGCVGPITANMNVTFPMLQTLVEELPIAQTDCF
jgi:hypothetical protein